MPHQNSHLSDSELLSAADAELSPRRLRILQAHLATCSACQTRLADLTRTAADFTAAYRSTFTLPLPLDQSAATARLKARLAQRTPTTNSSSSWKWALALPVLAALVFLTLPTNEKPFPAAIIPNPQLTPGESIALSKSQVCQANQPAFDQRQIPEALKQAVLAEYGVKSAPNESYEVDFLITPELGGSASIRNLWPQPYFTHTWNAHVKDVLEDRLHQLVCRGDLDLPTAQREIATNWVDAYKKYVSPNTPM